MQVCYIGQEDRDKLLESVCMEGSKQTRHFLQGFIAEGETILTKEVFHISVIPLKEVTKRVK
jgi:hypothetical protein